MTYEQLEKRVMKFTEENRELRKKLDLMRKHIRLYGDQYWYVSYLQDEKMILERQYDELQDAFLKLSRELTRIKSKHTHTHLGEVHIRG